ncbi:tRNA (adenosine(37)-N6)-threonylcarbamoyltransferase complex dimerization subunit type 1 TsaB [Thiomicrorhabdus sp.]|uniref:tRNA (adenosine(37)-N6)-threonylcarbamoyltransferase complex dimerization subunit type 1 TsaB n=1 Tax=Thiomicrorhabdus sp. TaxID=2039724 RepID=UPI0029C8B038|nr:tRNA (adenosine(37)-N6)-threonylcarbamoyltransferase complex dimerization subunit type 1 TsaB [Thiomicrorhabdus sp.]
MTTRILGIDTSTAACSVALLDGDRLYVRHEILPQKHAHRVLEMVDEILAESALDPGQLTALAYGEGPGAFTGIRIAAGVIQGLALGWQCPVIAVSSLEAMAFSALEERSKSIQERSEAIEWCALLDARMDEVYVQKGCFDAQSNDWQAQEVRLLSPESASAALSSSEIGVGDVAQTYPLLAEKSREWIEFLPHASGICRLALKKLDQAQALEQQIPAPVYLRNKVAETLEERKARHFS